MNVRGKRQTFTYANDTLSITELLRKPEVVGYLEKDGSLTYASQREKLRKFLAKGGSTRSWLWNTRPGTRRHHESKTRVIERNDEGQIFRERPREEKCYLDPNDHRGQSGDPPVPSSSTERTLARRVLKRYPQLREFLQRNRRVSEKSLHAKVRTWIRKGKIPNHVFNPEPEIVPRGRLLGNNVIGLRGKHLAYGLLKFHQERRDQVSPGETPEQGLAEPDLRDGGGGSGHRASY